ncbi:MAG: Uma2 family endonuclease [Oscillospiraceae bacterium]|jgi:Uma2 family endonuclease|nr:Uma2 family endonuclease [Oscillospiraceae bacterium]
MQAQPQPLKDKREKKKKYTIKDWEQLPEGSKYELIDGELVMQAQPTLKHQELLITIGAALNGIFKGTKCRVFGEPAVRLSNREKDIFAPDLAVVCDEKKLTDGCIIGAPDLIVEIQSPSTAGRDRLLKFNAYKEAGVREYWIVDPIHQTVEVFFWQETDVPYQYSNTGKLKINIAGDAEIDLETVFQ